jgi:S-adenosylmethionine decarboxylase
MSNFFEGPEKRIEIHFEEKKCSLLDISRNQWDTIVTLAKCSILSGVQTEKCHAYLLSESSLFVWNNKIVLKTCGKTEIFQSVPAILEAAHVSPLYCMYSHRDFFKPDLQPFPYHSVAEEEKHFRRLFPKGHIKINQNSLYTFYVWESEQQAKLDSNEILPTYQEVSTTEMNSDLLKLFTKKENQSYWVREILSKVNTRRLEIDEFWFQPQGYSCNLLGEEKNQTFYMTIHLTPQSPSFLSVETNLERSVFESLLQDFKLSKDQTFFVL